MAEKSAKEETVIENATPDYAAGLVSTQVVPPQPHVPLAGPKHVIGEYTCVYTYVCTYVCGCVCTYVYERQRRLEALTGTRHACSLEGLLASLPRAAGRAPCRPPSPAPKTVAAGEATCQVSALPGSPRAGPGEGLSQGPLLSNGLLSSCCTAVSSLAYSERVFPLSYAFVTRKTVNFLLSYKMAGLEAP